MLARKLQGAAAAARPHPTFVSSSINRTNTVGNTVTAPSGIQNGDLLVAVLFNVDPTAEPITLPSGWSRLTETETANNYFVLATKTAASESGNYTFTFNQAAVNSIAILVYRNATRVNTVGTFKNASSATATASSITPTYAGTLCAMFANETNSTVSTPPAGFTQRALQSGTTAAMGVYDLANQAASATSAASLVWSVSGQVASIQFQVTNEPSVAPEFVASANTQNTSNGTSLTISKPSGTIENDLMIAVLSGSVGVSWTGDTGWTEAADQGAVPSLRVAYKIATASEGSSYTFTSSGSATLSGCILTYRYAAYDTIAGAFTTGANPLVLTSISPSLSQSVLLACGARPAASITLGTPTSMTAKVTDNDATSPSYIVCDQTVAKGPTGTRSMSTGSTNNVAGIMLAIKPTRSL